MTNFLSPVFSFFVTYFGVFLKAKPYSLYVLVVLFLTYLLNQLDRYALSITNLETAQELKYGDRACFKKANTSDAEGKLCAWKNVTTNQTACETIENFNGSKLCYYDYNGQGIEYQIVIGPIFILMFTFTGIFLSIISDQLKNRRVIILTLCLLFWSIMTILTGFVTEFWQLVILRLGLGFGQAGCNPLATSLIADYFSTELRGSAISVYNWGIYTGYSLSFAIGHQILKQLNWRWVFYISGIPGLIVSALIIFTIREPKKETASKAESKSSEDETPVPKERVVEEPYLRKLLKVIKQFAKPSVILLLLAGSIRNAAGYVWGTNNNSYYVAMQRSPDEISAYLGTIPLIFGIVGSFVGGFISDLVAKKAQPWMRVWVLVISQIVAAPFAAAVLFFPPPASYFWLIPTYIFGEMWVGVCLSVLVELVPENLRTTGVGFYFFVISNIGGNMQLLLPPVQAAIKNSFNLDKDVDALRGALYVFYPGEYVLGSALFLLTLFVLKRDLNVSSDSLDPYSQVNPLVDNEITDEQHDEIQQVSNSYENSAYSNDEMERKGQKIN